MFWMNIKLEGITLIAPRGQWIDKTDKSGQKDHKGTVKIRHILVNSSHYPFLNRKISIFSLATSNSNIFDDYDEEWPLIDPSLRAGKNKPLFPPLYVLLKLF